MERPDAEGKFAAYYIFKFSAGLDLAYSVQRPLLESIEKQVHVIDVPGTATENLTTISVIASGHRRMPGVLSRMLETLNAANIAVYQLADSEMSITCLVSESEVHRAVRLLHEKLFEQ